MTTVEDPMPFFLVVPNKDAFEPIKANCNSIICGGKFWEKSGILTLMDSARLGIDGVMCAVVGDALVGEVFTHLEASTLWSIAHDTLGVPGISYNIRNCRLTLDEKFALQNQGPNKDERAGLCNFTDRWTDFTYFAVNMDGLNTITRGVLDSNGVWTKYVGRHDEMPTGELVPGVPKCMSRAVYLHYCYWGYRWLRGARPACVSMLDRYVAVVEGVRSEGGPGEWVARDAEAFRAWFGIVPMESAMEE